MDIHNKQKNAKWNGMWNGKQAALILTDHVQAS